MTGYITQNELAPILQTIIKEAGTELDTTVITESEFLRFNNMSKGFYIITPSNPTSFPKNNNHVGLVSTAEVDGHIYRIIILIDQNSADVYTRSQTFTIQGSLENETNWRNIVSFDELPLTDSATIGGSDLIFSAEGAKLLNESVSSVKAQVQEILDNPTRGKSAFEIAQDAGFIGTNEDWLLSLKGEKGDKGDIGIGEKGDKGDIGETGEQGDSAYQVAVKDGFEGSIGEWLATLKGANGEQGIQGEVGQGLKIEGNYNSPDELPTNPDPNTVYFVGQDLYYYDVNNGFVNKGSIKGETGEQGEKGETGEKGDRGERGLTGLTGLTGANGLDGAKGDKGDAGANGLDGASAYEVAVKNGFVGDEIAFLDSLKGEMGLIGLTGEKGDAGEKGDSGERGIQGIQGIQGEQGEKGEMGDSFTITASYSTIEELEADSDNTEIPVGAFVIISSVDPDNDPDNGRVYIKKETGYQYQLTMRGLKGETGDRGLQGLQGLQGDTGEKGDSGARGLQGVQGLKGDDGKSLRIRGTVEAEHELSAITGELGDAYWVGTRLYIWTDDPRLVTVSGWYRGSDLQGKAGVQGPQGIRGLKGDDGVVEGIGTAELLTEAKTLREGINELFLYGNDVKNKTVNALLSKQSDLPIDGSSSWEDIEKAINDLSIGVQINGRDVSGGFSLDDIKKGDFISFITRGAYNQQSNLNPIEAGGAAGGVTRFQFAPYSDNRVIVVACGRTPTDATTVKRTMVAILEKSNTGIRVVSPTLITGNNNSGLHPAIVRMSNNTYIVVASSGTAASPVYRLSFHRIIINGDAITVQASTVVDSTTTYSGDDIALLRLSDTRFMVAAENGSAGSRISIWSHNPSDNTSATYVRISTQLYTDAGRNNHLIPINGNLNKILFLTGTNTSVTSTTSHAVILRTITVNPSTYAMTISGSHYLENLLGAVNSMRAIEFKNPTTNKTDIAVFSRDSTSDNRIKMTTLTEDTSTNSGFSYKRTVLNTGIDSGGTANNSRLTMHSAIDLGNGLIGLVYQNSNAQLQAGVIDTKEANYNIKLNGTITGAITSKQLPHLFKFGNGDIGLARMSSSSTSSAIIQFADFYFSGYKKYREDYPEYIIAVAKEDAKIGGVLKGLSSS